MSHLIKTIQDRKILTPDVLYIDPNNTQIEGDLTYSVHLVIENEEFGKLEYNSIFEETCSPTNSGPQVCPPTNGTNSNDRGQLLSEIAIQLYRKAPTTHIISPKKMKPNTVRTWHLPNEYDETNQYTYVWEIIDLSNSVITIPPSGIVVGGQGTKAIDIKLLNVGLLYLKCNIFRQLNDGTLVCPNTITKFNEIGAPTGSVVISRNRFT